MRRPSKPRGPVIVNPTAGPGALRPVELITDRAKRYRAQAAIEQEERVCIYCGAPGSAARRLDVEHIDGDEANANPDNLAYACRSCNTAKGAHFARLGLGRKTRQYNPAAEGAKTAAQWMTAVMSITPKDGRRPAPSDPPMDPLAAVAMIRATPAAARARFARQLSRYKGQRARTKRGRADEVPF